MGASLLPIEELAKADVDAWRELADEAAEPNPFFDPDFALPAAEALQPKGLGLLVTRESGEWTSCLPVQRTRGWHGFPLKGLVAWRHLYSFLGAPLARGGSAMSNVRELIAGGLRYAGAFIGLDLLMLEGAVGGAALEAALGGLGLHSIELDRYERAAVKRSDEPSTTNLSRKHRQNFARLRRRLEEDLGGQLTLRDRTGDPAAQQEFLRMEASGWKGGGGTRTALEPMGHSELFQEVCRRFAARGRLELLAAEAGNTDVAMLCNLVAGETAFTFKIASEEQFARFSPGAQLKLMYLDHFRDAGLRLADSCEGAANPWVSRLWRDRLTLVNRAIPAPTVRGAIAAPGLKGLARIRRKGS